MIGKLDGKSEEPEDGRIHEAVGVEAVYNKGYIANLPTDACVEVPTFADDTGLHPAVIGALPPQFKGKSLRVTPTIDIPANVKSVDVPLDPALAIHKRFRALVSQKT